MKLSEEIERFADLFDPFNLLGFKASASRVKDLEEQLASGSEISEWPNNDPTNILAWWDVHERDVIWMDGELGRLQSRLSEAESEVKRLEDKYGKFEAGTIKEIDDFKDRCETCNEVTKKSCDSCGVMERLSKAQGIFSEHCCLGECETCQQTSKTCPDEQLRQKEPWLNVLGEALGGGKPPTNE